MSKIKTAAKRTVKKTARKATRSTMNYAKGVAARYIVMSVLVAIVAYLPQLGINLPTFITGNDTLSMLAFIVVGMIVYDRKISAGRIIALVRTMIK